MSLLKRLKHAVRGYVWFYVPYDKEIKLKYFLSSKLRKMVREMRTQSLNSKPVHRNRKLRIVFMCQAPQVWNSIKSIYLAARRDPEVDAYILTLPEKIMHENYDVNHEEYEPENHAYALCSEFGENVIDAYNQVSHEWFDLKGLEPDYVFIPRPYDIHLPPCYRSDVLKEYTKICFNSYGYSIEVWGYKMGYGVDFILKCSLIFAQSQTHEAMLNNILSFLHVSNIKAKYLGFPRFDLFSNLTVWGGGY